MITNPYGDNNPYTNSNPKRVNDEDIEMYGLEDFGLTASAVKAQHFGLSVKDQDGNELPNQFYVASLESAIAKVEHRLDIVILPRIVEDRKDFHRGEYSNYMFLHATQKPMLQLESLRMEYGNHQIFNYPSEWWKVYNREGHVQIMPSMLLSSGGQMNSLIYAGYPMIAGLPQEAARSNNAPQLFYMRYVAGMLPPTRSGVTRDWEMPSDLWQLIAKVAVREVFQQYGRLIIGPGIAKITNSKDDISQTVETTQTAMYGGASAEILQLDKDIEELYRGLRAYYGLNIGLAGG